MRRHITIWVVTAAVLLSACGGPSEASAEEYVDALCAAFLDFAEGGQQVNADLAELEAGDPQTVDEAQEALGDSAGELQRLGQLVEDLAEDLAEIPAPAIEDGERVHMLVVDAFSDASAQLNDATAGMDELVEELGAVMEAAASNPDGPTPEQLEQLAALETRLNEVGGQLQALENLEDPFQGPEVEGLDVSELDVLYEQNETCQQADETFAS